MTKWNAILLIAVAVVWACSATAALAQPAEAEHAAPAHGDAGHDATGHEAGHDAHGEQGMLDVDKQLAGFTVVVFVLLLLVLWKFAWGPIAKGLDARENRIASNIAAAEKANADAQGVLGQYEQKLAAAAEEVRKMIEEARRDAEHTQKQIVAKATQETQLLHERSMRDIETATAQSLKELAERSANLAVELAAKITRQQLGPADHARLVEDAVKKFQSPSSN